MIGSSSSEKERHRIGKYSKFKTSGVCRVSTRERNAIWEEKDRWDSSELKKTWVAGHTNAILGKYSETKISRVRRLVRHEFFGKKH